MMKITVINGTEKHGVTYRLKELFLQPFQEKAETTEYYLPRWGIPKITVFTGKLMSDIVWEKLSARKRSQFTKNINRLSEKFLTVNYEKSPRTNVIIKIKFLFCRMMQQSLHENDPEYLDGKYWAERGWLGRKRPWKVK